MRTGDVINAVTAVVDGKRLAIGCEGVSYPPLPSVPKSPWCMVRQSLYAPSRIEKARAGQQIVYPSIDLVFLVASDPKRPQDAARLDGLVEPVLDLFDANATGGDVNLAFTGLLTESVDHIWNDATVRRTTVNWGEAGFCHALILTLDAAFKRKAIAP